MKKATAKAAAMLKLQREYNRQESSTVRRGNWVVLPRLNNQFKEYNSKNWFIAIHAQEEYRLVNLATGDTLATGIRSNLKQFDLEKKFGCVRIISNVYEEMIWTVLEPRAFDLVLEVQGKERIETNHGVAILREALDIRFITNNIKVTDFIKIQDRWHFVGYDEELGLIIIDCFEGTVYNKRFTIEGRELPFLLANRIMPGLGTILRGLSFEVAGFLTKEVHAKKREV